MKSMDDRDSDYEFTADEERQFTEALAATDAVLRDLGRRFHMSLRLCSARGWPGRTLRKRRWLKTYTLNVSLNAAYLNTGVIRWDIRDVWMIDLNEFYRKLLMSRDIAAAVDTDRMATPDIARLLQTSVNENLAR